MKKLDFENEINEIIGYLNVKANRKLKSSTKNNYQAIFNRLKEGFKVEELKKIIDLKVFQWSNNDKMKKYLQPSTLFSSHNFKKYLLEVTIRENNKEDKSDQLKSLQKQVEIDFDEEEYDTLISKFKTMPYYQYLSTKHWLNFKKQALIFYNYKCQVCGNGENLAIHHNNYFNRGRETFNDVTCLCSNCHEKIHRKDGESNVKVIDK